MIFWILCLGGLLVLSYLFLTRNFLGYTIIDGAVVYQHMEGTSWKRQQRRLPNADPKTFKIFGFSGVYAKDKNHVYLEGRLIREANPQHFKILEDLYKYAKDDQYLFCGTQKIGDIADGFTYLGNGYATNDKHAFKQGNIIEGAVGKTFMLLDEKGFYARDHQSVFCVGKKLEGADGPTFRHIQHYYYADKKQVYYLSTKIEQARPQDFDILGERYARSGNHIFYKGKLLGMADAASFKVVPAAEGIHYAQDKNHKYWGDRKVDAFPSS